MRFDKLVCFARRWSGGAGRAWRECSSGWSGSLRRRAAPVELARVHKPGLAQSLAHRRVSNQAGQLIGHLRHVLRLQDSRRIWFLGGEDFKQELLAQVSAGPGPSQYGPMLALVAVL